MEIEQKLEKEKEEIKKEEVKVEEKIKEIEEKTPKEKFDYEQLNELKIEIKNIKDSITEINTRLKGFRNVQKKEIEPKPDKEKEIIEREFGW